MMKSASLPLPRAELLLVLEGLALLPHDSADALLNRLARLRGPRPRYYARRKRSSRAPTIPRRDWRFAA